MGLDRDESSSTQSLSPSPADSPNDNIDTTKPKTGHAVCEQLHGLFYRFYLAKKRSPIWTIVELLFPVIALFGWNFIRIFKPSVTHFPAASYVDSYYDKCPFGRYGNFIEGQFGSLTDELVQKAGMEEKDEDGVNDFLEQHTKESWKCQNWKQEEVDKLQKQLSDAGLTVNLTKFFAETDLDVWQNKRQYDGSSLLEMPILMKENYFPQVLLDPELLRIAAKAAKAAKEEEFEFDEASFGEMGPEPAKERKRKTSTRPIVFIDAGASCKPLQTYIEAALQELQPGTYKLGSHTCTDMNSAGPNCELTLRSISEYKNVVYTVASTYAGRYVKKPKHGFARTYSTAIIVCKHINVAKGKFDIDIRFNNHDGTVPSSTGYNPLRTDGLFTPYVAKRNVWYSHDYLNIQSLVHSWTLHVSGVRPIVQTGSYPYNDFFNVHRSSVYNAIRNLIGASLKEKMVSQNPNIKEELHQACYICHSKNLQIFYSREEVAWCQSIRSRFVELGHGETWSLMLNDYETSPDNPEVIRLTGCYTLGSVTLSEEEAFLLKFELHQRLKEWVTIISRRATEKYRPLSYSESAMPVPAIKYNRNVHGLNAFIPALALITILFFIPIVWRISYLMIYDKEYKIWEMFAIMGVPHHTLWGSWYLLYPVYTFPTIIAVSIIMWFQFPEANLFLLWLINFCFIIACLSFGVLMSAIIRKSASGGIKAVTIYMLGGGFLLFSERLGPVSLSNKRGMCLMFSTAYMFLIKNCSVLEFFTSPDGGSAIFANFTRSVDGQSIFELLAWLLFDAFWMFLVGWYVGQVFPGATGAARKWYFPVQRIIDSIKKCKNKPIDKKMTFDPSDHDEDQLPAHDYFEKLVEHEEVVVDVQRLDKVFKGGLPLPSCLRKWFPNAGVHAAKGVSLKVLQGEIFVLLGHNGAGKTTVISMITGMIHPSKGHSLVKGYDITIDPREARKHIGYCPQHDILFDYMTVYEHLRLYSILRGLHRSRIEECITKAVQALGIEEKLHVKSCKLSGGQKRRLSVAIALVGDIKAIFLDEPSSGMDPYTRRALWDTLKALKSQCAILLTTHSMEEAEFLGNRIGIMAAGEMKCMGSSLFLKQKLGIGYSLSFTKLPTKTYEQQQALQSFVSKSLPGAIVTSNISLELTYKVPYEASPLLPDFLEHIETHTAEYGVGSFSLSVTTLEEVFLTIGAHSEVDIAKLSEQDEKRQHLLNAANSAPEDEENRPSTIANDLSDPFSAVCKSALPSNFLTRIPIHSYSQIVKRVHMTRRNFSYIACQLLCPVLATILLLMFGDALMNLKDQPANIRYTALQNHIYRSDLTPANILVGGNTPTHLKNCPNNNLFTTTDFPLKYADEETKSRVQQMDKFMASRKDAPEFGRFNAMYFDVEESTSLKFHLWHNSTFQESLPAGLNEVANCWLKSNDKNSFINIRFWPLEEESKLLEILAWSVVDIFLVMTILVLPAGWGSLIVKEKASGAKHAQHVAGLSPVVYWMVNYVWDFVFFIPVAELIIWLCRHWGTGIVRNGRHVGFRFGLYTFGLSAASFSYFLSLLLNSATANQIVQITIGVFTSILVSFAVALEDSIQDMYNMVMPFLRLIPHVAFTEFIGIMTQITSDDTSDDDHKKKVYFSGINAATKKLYQQMIIEAVVYLVIVILVDYVMMNRFLDQLRRLTSKRPSDSYAGGDEDSDVKDERERLQRNPNTAAGSVSLLGLRKEFSSKNKCCPPAGSEKVAVKNLWYSVEPGQCFGFLGVNGAGKTTTLQMLMGLLGPTSGDALLSGKSIVARPTALWRQMGYCPQFDAHNDYLSGNEHIDLFLRLRMVKEGKIRQLRKQIVEVLGIKEYASRPAATYSGGTRRKLSLGIAFLKDPHVVFLDEPSTGVDPAARRRLWSIISLFASRGDRAVILTTHSMEECDALCDRLAIMKEGGLCCIGTRSHIKEKFGGDYQLQISFAIPDTAVQQAKRMLEGSMDQSYSMKHAPVVKSRTFAKGKSVEAMGLVSVLDQEALATEEFYKEALKDFAETLQAEFPGCRLIEEIGFYQTWTIPKEAKARSRLFRFVENNKANYSIENYSVSDSSLEAIFVQFCREDEPENEMK